MFLISSELVDGHQTAPYQPGGLFFFRERGGGGSQLSGCVPDPF